MQEILLVGGVGLSLIIIPVIQALKKVGLPEKWCPILAIALGLVVAVIYSLSGGGISLWAAIAGGILSGAGAAGLYDNFTTNPTK